MPGETITIQAGQCGNQVGLKFWEQLASEHGILADGTSKPYIHEEDIVQFEGASAKPVNDREDRAELFFSLSDTGRYTPRSILIDLEPSVVTRATNTLPMFNPRNIHLSEGGEGAGNNWGKGYDYGTQHAEDLLDLLDRECDKCENLSNFQLIHSVAGGTGSGVGSCVLELLNDRYGTKKLIGTALVFPSSSKTSDVIVQPYNTLLALKRLLDISDAALVFDNDRLNEIENKLFGASNSSDMLFGNETNAFDTKNKLISFVLSNISNPIRFPGYMYTSYESIISSLVPTPELKFLSASIAPFADLSGFHDGRIKHNFTNMNEYDLTLELLDDKYKLNVVGKDKLKYISVLTYLIGKDFNQDEIRKGKLRALKRLEFVPWTSSTVSMINGKRSPFLQSSTTKSLNGLLISNNTSIIPLLRRSLQQYDALIKRSAFINTYLRSKDPEEEQMLLDHFAECKETVIGVLDEYKSCQTMQYLEDEFLDHDEIMT